MEDQVQKSCWGVTAWALVLAGGVLALMYVFGGADVTPATIVASQ